MREREEKENNKREKEGGTEGDNFIFQLMQSNGISPVQPQRKTSGRLKSQGIKFCIRGSHHGGRITVGLCNCDSSSPMIRT